MAYTWNLDKIYRGFDDPAFAADLDALKAQVGRFDLLTKALADMDPALALAQGVELLESITDLANKLAEYATLRQAANTTDAEAGSWLGQVLAVFSEAAAPEAAFKAWAAALPNLMELAAEDETLREYGYMLTDWAESSRYLLPGQCEKIIARYQLSGGNAWSELQQYLTSTLTVDYNGGTTTLSAIRNLAYDPDPAVRKAAFEAELAAYPKIRDAVAYALNSIKLETLSECQLRGYESPLDCTLKQSHMERATLEAMLAAMDEYLPKFQQYLKAKARALGHEKGLPWYDLFAPMGASTAKFTVEEAKNYLLEQFSAFDSELAQMIEKAFDEEWIDFFPRPGKQGGAFCGDIEAIGESRILANFDGSFSDIVTLAHELGHAFHNDCIRSHRSLNHGYSMPLAETASTFNECVVMASAIAKAQGQERLALIESQLQDATQIICDIYSRYRFEAAVFAARPERFMDADTLCAMMLDAQAQCYGDALDPDIRHSYMWLNKGHYYGPIFYNFPYAFGGLFARGLYARYEQEGAEFLPKYKKLLYTTTVASAEDTAKVAGIDLTDKEFWRSALQAIADQIDLFCQLAGQ